MIRSFGGLACILAASIVLWSCEQIPATELPTDEPGEDVLRSAAINSENARDYAGAVNYYHKLYVRDAEDLDAALGVARNLRYLGSTQQAIDGLEEVLAKHPGRTDLRAELGKAQFAVGRTTDAIATLTEVTDSQPNDWQALSALGIAYDESGNFTKAQAKFQAALAISPDNPKVLNNLAWSKARSGDLDGGIAIFQRLVRRPSSSAQARQNLALLYAQKGDCETAENLFKRDLPAKWVKENLEYFNCFRSRLAGDVMATPSDEPRLDQRLVPGGGRGAAVAVAPPARPAATADTQATEPETATAEIEVEQLAQTLLLPSAGQAEPSGQPQTTANVATPEAPEVTVAPPAPPPPAGDGIAEPTEPLPQPQATAGAATPEAPEVTVAVAPPAPSPPAGDGTAGLTEATITGFKIQLGIFATPEHAAQRSRGLRDTHRDLLGGLEFEAAKVDRGGITIGYRLLAGPLAGEALAADLCTRLHSRNLKCSLVAP